MNHAYRYPNIELWYDEAWKGTEAKIHPLVQQLNQLAFENIRPVSSTGKFKNLANAHADPKTNIITLPDVVEHWEKQGLHYHFAGMGGVAWLAMVPHHVQSNSPILLVFHCADMKDPLWAMDTLEYYRSYNETAAKEGFVVHYIVQNSAFTTGIYTDILLELSALWRLDMENLYLDLSLLKAAKIPLPQVPGLETQLFPKECSFYGVPAVKITNLWQAFTGHQYICKNINSHNPEFNVDRLIHSTLGKKIADGMRWEHQYRRFDDPGLLAEFTEMGLSVQAHFTRGERWLSVVPREYTQPKPLLIVMKEVRTVDEFMALTALQFYSEFLELSANGEFAMLFFAMESPEDNELLLAILKDMERLYPIDRSRIYLTGQSHNGYLAMEFARRHPDLITAIATLNDRHGIASPNFSVDPVPISDEMINDYVKTDLPLINICGAIENVFPHTVKGSQGYRNQITALHRRLTAFRCPDRTDQEIEASLVSPDKATRINGLPADHTEIIYSMGMECYISDLKNIDGKWHLRFVTLENLPHMISPQMAELSWSFLRRFSRNSDGSIAE